MRHHRPLPARITIALVLVLITTAWNLLRLWASISFASALQKYAQWPGPAYIGISGGLFAGAGLGLAWGLWRRAAWAPAALLGGAIGYAAWAWVDRLFIQPQLTPDWPFALLVTGGLLAFVVAVALDPRNHNYFGKEAHEREEQDR